MDPEIRPPAETRISACRRDPASHRSRTSTTAGIRTVSISDGAISDMAMKEQALARMTPPDSQPGCYGVNNTLLAFLNTL